MAIQKPKDEEDIDELLKGLFSEIELWKEEQEKRFQTFEMLASSQNEEDRQIADKMWQQFELEFRWDEYDSQFYSDHI